MLYSWANQRLQCAIQSKNLPALLFSFRFVPGPYNGPYMPDGGANTFVDCTEVPTEVPVWRTPPPPPLLYSAGEATAVTAFTALAVVVAASLLI